MIEQLIRDDASVRDDGSSEVGFRLKLEGGGVAQPGRGDIFYGGGWHAPFASGYDSITSPATGQKLADVASCSRDDVEAAIVAARHGFQVWRDVAPAERARILRQIANVIRVHADEFSMIDALDGGNPVREMARDAAFAADTFDFFAGLVTEMKGDSIPMGRDDINFTLREPLGVVARIVAFNHPFMFLASKAAAPLAAGNAVIMKPPVQAPLSALRFAQLVGHLLPDGVLGVLPGGQEVGEVLSTDARVDAVTLIGSVSTGRKVMKAAAATLKPVLLELGGKNALIAYSDVDPAEVAAAVVAGMNFTWCGQSCGSTSRAFLHADIHDAVIAHVKDLVTRFVPGIPTDPATTMGAIISKAQHESILRYIEIGRSEGARLICGGRVPSSPELANGNFIEPTVFAGVTPKMRIASEEIFGPVLSILKWNDPENMLRDVNGVEYGLTCSIWTNDLETAHRTAQRVEAGYVWINDTSKHFLGAPFGGFKQSGIGREECLSELLAFTREKNIHITLRRRGIWS
ncbi:aldehyde dehydrogenase family protein [Bradyrhizobium sp. KBS0727]|nr:aldehyde dehydrogenase family protein [Bradyrhizobium sp. KBS0725]QDW48760.1 aldehyde dehydrogenase family protein [Bradyrhizobium sp. KBS0727]